MNRLTPSKQTQVVAAPVEGNSIRCIAAAARVAEAKQAFYEDKLTVAHAFEIARSNRTTSAAPYRNASRVD